MLRDIKNLFENEDQEKYYKQVWVSNLIFGVKIILNIKVMVIEKNTISGRIS